MPTLTFDSLRYARRLRESGMPEPQADVQAELMAESFGVIAEKVLTKDHFEAVLKARLDAGFAEQQAKFDKRFADQDVKFDKRFASIDQRFADQEAKFDKRFASIDQRFADQEAKFDKRFADQDVKFDKRFADQDVKFDKRFAEQDARFESRFVRLEKTLFLHTWMLGLIVLVLVVPQLQAWLA